MTHGLKATTVEAIQKIFAAYPQVEKAILYGSRAKGNFRPGSDIDIALMGSSLDLSLLYLIAARTR